MRYYYQPKSGKKGEYTLRDNTYRRIWYIIADYKYFKQLQAEASGQNSCPGSRSETAPSSLKNSIRIGRPEAWAGPGNNQVGSNLAAKQKNDRTAPRAGITAEDRPGVAVIRKTGGIVYKEKGIATAQQFGDAKVIGPAPDKFLSDPGAASASTAESSAVYTTQQPAYMRYIQAIEAAMKEIPPEYLENVMGHIADRRKYRDMEGVSEKTIKIWVQRFIWHVAHNLGEV